MLARVSDYLDSYLRDFSNVVAEEDYYQRVVGALNTRPRSQHLRSDLLLVRTSSKEVWTRIHRTINLPTLPLVFLMPANLPSFRFERRGEEVIEGLLTWRLDYEEVGRPTVVRQFDTGRDVPSAGSLWLDPLTGRIVKTAVRTGDDACRMDAAVVYRPNDALGIWTPVEMRETYRMIDGTETIIGTATYSNFRRFQVTTLEIIKAP